MISRPLSLLHLPPELLLEISDHLSPDGILALKFTHRLCNETIPLPSLLSNACLSDCARIAIRTYLAPPNPNPTRLRCTLCKTTYPTGSFSSSSSPACIPMLLSDGQPAEVIELPQNICSWHVGRLARVIHTKPGGRNEWTSEMDSMCMHCGSVKGWSECDCHCSSCSTKPVRTYTRYLNNESECRRFLFWRSEAPILTDTSAAGSQTELMVRETCKDPGTMDKHYTMNLPVLFETTSAENGKLF